MNETKIFETLKSAVDNNTITRKTACRVLIKYGLKNEYIAMLKKFTLEYANYLNYLIDKFEDGFLDAFNGLERLRTICRK